MPALHLAQVMGFAVPAQDKGKLFPLPYITLQLLQWGYLNLHHLKQWSKFKQPGAGTGYLGMGPRYSLVPGPGSAPTPHLPVSGNAAPSPRTSPSHLLPFSPCFLSTGRAQPAQPFPSLGTVAVQGGWCKSIHWPFSHLSGAKVP